MMIFTKTKSCDSSLGDNFPSLHGVILLFPITDRRFYEASWFSRFLPCPPIYLLQPPFCVCGQRSSHFHPQSWLLPPWSPQFLGVLNYFHLLPPPPGFSAELEKIRLISDVPSMLLEKPFTPLLSWWLPFSFPTPRRSDSSSLATFQLDSPSLHLRIWVHRFMSQKDEGFQHNPLQLCFSLNPHLPLSHGACDRGSITLTLGQNQPVHLYVCSRHPAASGTLFPKLFLSRKSSVSTSPVYNARYVGHINEQPTFLLPFYPFKLPPNPMFCLQTSWKTHLHLLSMLWCRFSSLKFLPSDLSLPPKYFSTTTISRGWRCRKHHAWEEPSLPLFPSPPQVHLPLWIFNKS